MSSRRPTMADSDGPYRIIVEEMGEGAATVSEHGLLLYVNQRLADLIGRDRCALIGTDVADLVLRADQARLVTLLGAPAGRTNRAELNLAARDGTTVPTLTSATGLDIDGVLVRCLVATDLTGSRRSEQQIADANTAIAGHAADLERADRDLARSKDDLAQFAYVVSHDLSEPLRAISGFTGLLRRRYRGKLDSDADEFIDFITAGASRMQQQIEDLLAYSRVGTRAQPIVAVDAQQVLDGVIAGLSTRINDTGGTVHSDVLPVINADPAQLTQVFANLIRNSLTFVAADMTPLVLVTAKPADGAWQFTVADNGIGIPAAHRQRVFGLFKKLNARDAYPDTGTGAGLTIAQRIVQRHGGSIWIDDNPGGGTRTTFTIPAADPGAPTPSATDRDRDRQAGRQ